MSIRFNDDRLDLNRAVFDALEDAGGDASKISLSVFSVRWTGELATRCAWRPPPPPPLLAPPPSPPPSTPPSPPSFSSCPPYFFCWPKLRQAPISMSPGSVGETAMLTFTLRCLSSPLKQHNGWSCKFTHQTCSKDSEGLKRGLPPIAGHDKRWPSGYAEHDENDRTTNLSKVQGATWPTGW